MIDGAGPFRILWSVILPQFYPALMAITVFHIVYAWNDYFGPLIYLSAAREKWPVSIALSVSDGDEVGVVSFEPLYIIPRN